MASQAILCTTPFRLKRVSLKIVESQSQYSVEIPLDAATTTRDR